MDRSAIRHEIPQENPPIREAEINQTRKQKGAFMGRAVGIVKRNSLTVLAAGLGFGLALRGRWPAITTWAKTDMPAAARRWLGIGLPATGTPKKVKVGEE